MDAEYMTIAAAAKDLKISRQTLHRYVKNGEVVIKKIGRYSGIHQSELARFRKRIQRVQVGKDAVVVIEKECGDIV